MPQIEERMITFNTLPDFMEKNEDYYSIMSKFKCNRVPALQKYFIEDAIRDDFHHEAKTYIVYDNDAQMIIAYFSIRTTCMVRQLTQIVENKRLVKKVIPCIEISKLCINDIFLEFLHKNGYNNKGIGAYVYRTCVAPMVVVLSALIGFDEVVLYAVKDKEGKVVKAYRNHMGFETIEDDGMKIISVLGDATPLIDEYSDQCEFMFQEVDEILRKHKGGYQYV